MSRNPNIILIFTDEQRYDTIGAAGFPWMKTPNLDRMIKEGCLFTNAYTPNPVCIPARHNLITGLTARYHGYPNNESYPYTADLPVLPKLLSNAGYETRAIGKMHFHPVRRHHGFDKMELMEEIPIYREWDEYAMYLKEKGYGSIINIHGVRNLLYHAAQRSLMPEEHHPSNWVGDRAADFLRTNRGRHPFFLKASFIAPHPPFHVPDSYADMYLDAELPVPRTSETPLSPAAQRRSPDLGMPHVRGIRRSKEFYHAAVSLVDFNTGKILSALEETGELENTMIIYTSDHGDFIGDYGLFDKQLPYDSCAKIPLIIRYPGIFKPGSRFEAFADLNDILPTILQTAGIKYPGPELPGESLAPGNCRKDRSYQYIEHAAGSQRWISLRNKTHKFNYYFAGGYEELFDMQKDPCESVNLLHGKYSQEITDIRDELYKMLCSYEERWGLPGMTYKGQLLVLEKPEELKIKNRVNPQFQSFHTRLTDQPEKSGMNDFFSEMFNASCKENKYYKLGDLNLEQWKENCARAGLDAEPVIKKIRKSIL
ncbi:MAG: hypothetical protein A2096_16550 [Spirochaetes bacterium GWF1_41_5]|nr:MAG: hypothetical protein A2096_16550 [Spirochaetes bacterium GWF1_41_5]HBE01633.1 arylsulfatase [Spirochaetia bacterium]